MIRIRKEHKEFNIVKESNYIRFLSKFGHIHAVYVTEEYGRPVLGRHMYCMMTWHGKKISVQRYRIGKGKPSYSAADSWDVFSQYSSQYVGNTKFFGTIEELMFHIEGLAYDAGLDM